MTFYAGQKWDRPKHKKHRWAKGKVRTDLRLRTALHALRRLLAEKGYQIYPVATWFRRNPQDFLAVPKRHPNMLLLVRPTKRRAIEIMYYGYRGSYTTVEVLLEKHGKGLGKVIWGKQLPAKDLANDWILYVSRNCLRELRLLTDV